MMHVPVFIVLGHLMIRVLVDVVFTVRSPLDVS